MRRVVWSILVRLLNYLHCGKIIFDTKYSEDEGERMCAKYPRTLVSIVHNSRTQTYAKIS